MRDSGLSGRLAVVTGAGGGIGAAVVRLLQDPTLQRQLAENAYQLIAEKYDWPSVAPHFLNLVERTAQAKKV